MMDDGVPAATLQGMLTTRPVAEPTGPGEESVWDYPRPPRIEPCAAHIAIVLGGVTIVDTHAGYRVLETSHPPNYYVPIDAFLDGAVVRSDGASFCEWKGRATYYTVRGGDRSEAGAAWGYERPSPAFAPLVGHVTVYPGRMDGCFVDGERVVAQPGEFYGGWITAAIKGPFKGGPGSRGW